MYSILRVGRVVAASLERPERLNWGNGSRLNFIRPNYAPTPVDILRGNSVCRGGLVFSNQVGKTKPNVD